MNSELQIFENSEFGAVRTVAVGDKTYFVASDVAKALGYKRPNDAVSAHCKGTLKRRIGVQTGLKVDGSQAMQEVEMLVIPEGDIYRLVVKSQLPSAEKFESWIFDEVLPSIRKHGIYAVDKVVLVMGYGDKKRWKKALGGQYGCLLIDEINTADIEFVREASMRCDYLMGTLNPDDPSLPVYKEYINHSRPLPQYKDDAPVELNNMLTEEPKPGWVHWFFSFNDNLGASPEKIAQIKLNTPKDTKLWKNKILGLRGRATGLVFSIFDEHRHVVTKR